jgi:hypothetical protein
VSEPLDDPEGLLLGRRQGAAAAGLPERVPDPPGSDRGKNGARGDEEARSRTAGEQVVAARLVGNQQCDSGRICGPAAAYGRP